MKAKEQIIPRNKASCSRRIFSPVFKIKVLDSYRNDADCQGNQRATARKYGIHRRQIQKWLQMETNLRHTVELGNTLSPNDTCSNSEKKNFKVNFVSFNRNLKFDSNSVTEHGISSSDKALDLRCPSRRETTHFKSSAISDDSRLNSLKPKQIYYRKCEATDNEENLDLSCKQKLHESEPEVLIKKEYLNNAEQESALCLVKTMNTEPQDHYYQFESPSRMSFNCLSYDCSLCKFPSFNCCAPISKLVLPAKFNSIPKYHYIMNDLYMQCCYSEYEPYAYSRNPVYSLADHIVSFPNYRE